MLFRSARAHRLGDHGLVDLPANDHHRHLGGALLFGYGLMLNLAPLEFSKVVGLYIATLFVVWQVINFFAFRSLPTAPILVGGALILTGGLIVSFWRTGAGA